MQTSRAIAEKPGTLQIQESFVSIEADGEKSYRLGESDWYEPFTDELGQLFASLRREYGGCTGKVYQDTPDGDPDPIGWVFEKKVEYEDADRAGLQGRDRFYTRQVWVTYRWI